MILPLPMQGRHPILVVLLLAVFTAGGVIGPTAHRVQHGAAKRSAQAESSCHAADVHAADGPLWTDDTDGRFVLECNFCATRLLVVPPTPVPTMAPRVGRVSTVEVRAHPAVVPTAIARFIRGPPPLSGARLA
jgi:hypothetical protein